MHESDLESYVLEWSMVEVVGNLSVHVLESTFLWSMVEADLERHVLEFGDGGFENVILGSGPVKVCSKESFPKFTSVS